MLESNQFSSILSMHSQKLFSRDLQAVPCIVSNVAFQSIVTLYYKNFIVSSISIVSHVWYLP